MRRMVCVIGTRLEYTNRAAMTRFQKEKSWRALKYYLDEGEVRPR